MYPKNLHPTSTKSKSPIRRLAALALAAALVVATLPVLAAPSDASTGAPTGAEAIWGWWNALTTTVSSLFGASEGDAGPSMDPDGLNVNDGGDAGAGMDPNGATTNDGGDAGIGMDPDGLNVKDGGEAGPDMDPNG